MALSERDRRELHQVVEHHLGGRAADLLLAMTEPELPAVLRAEMAELKGELRADMAGLRTEMADLRTELRAEMAELKGELRADMAGLRTEMADLRTELRGEMAGLRTELQGELRAQVPRLIGVNVASMVAVAGLVLTAARVA